jgi:predicted dinucleotide-binding enzyme
MTVSDHTVAIIGAGNIGSRLAANFAAGGQEIVGEICRITPGED